MPQINKPSRLERELAKHNIDEKEALAIIKSAREKPTSKRLHRTRCKNVRYGYISDTHIGQQEFDEELFKEATKRFNAEVDFVIHPGDHLEGMSGRPGHVYELALIGFQQQLNKAVELYNDIEVPMYGIDGNHDQWFKQKGDIGAIVGQELGARVPNYTHLGEWEGDLEIGAGARKISMKLVHPGDGTAYADSYKIQKRIESLSGGSKPNILHSGHYHKSIYLFRRNVHGFESGTLCGQTQWMRGKGIQAHKGYGIVELKFNEHGVQSLKHEWVPCYD